jgi:hypothetical protein
MSKDVSFVMDTAAGQDILTNMAMPTIKQSAEAIAGRAKAMAGSMSSDPPEISVSTTFGTIRRGTRAIATIKADGGGDAHKTYIGVMALTKARDAGRL